MPDRFPVIHPSFSRLQAGIMVLQYFLNPVDVVMVAVSQQDIGDPDSRFFSQRQYLGHFPGRVDDCRPAGGKIVYQVNEIFHRPEFQGLDGKGFGGLHVLSSFSADPRNRPDTPGDSAGTDKHGRQTGKP